MQHRLSLASCALVGSMAYITGDLVHEVLGHGGTCLLQGNRITLLNTVYFRSVPGSYWTDIGGPIANLVVGFLLYVWLQKRPSLSFGAKWLLLHAMVYNFCWFAGTLLDSIINKTGDWSFAIKELHMNIHAEHWLLLVVGVLSYILIMRTTRSVVQQQFASYGYSGAQLIVYPYLFALLTSFVIGLFFAGDRLTTAIGGAMEMVSSLPFLLVRFKPVSVSEHAA